MRPPLFRALWHDARAHAATIFAIVLVPFAAVTGFAIDAVNAVSVKQHLQYAIDASVLAGARSFKSEFSAERAAFIASEAFTANIATAHDHVTCDINSVTADRTDLSVVMNASCEIPTTFGSSIMGRREVRVSAAAQAAARHKVADVAMILDISLSMSDEEIADLKVAAKRAATLIIGTNPGERGRVALVPFASGVNAADFGNLATGRVSGADPESDNETLPHSVIERVCVTERTGMHAYTDAAPGPGNYVGSVLTVADADARKETGTVVRSSEEICPDSPILPLESNISTVHTALDGLQRSSLSAAGGFTAGHMGIAWAWYLISPNWTGVWTNTSFGGSAVHAPHPYRDPNRPKVVILMSDGTFQYGFEAPFTSGSWTREKLLTNNAARRFCRNMQNEGITIYSIGYNTSTEAEILLRFCAGHSSRFLTTDEPDELIELYEQITRDFMGVGLVQ
ncbi:MAG: TadE/TadG family type IV pilus assembly protein [Pseudomonadota bacterium]